jgi:hypothetical protein
MTALERSQKLRQEADEVLELINFNEHCSFIGPPVITGSYFLDLMIYPDVDLYLPPTTPENLLVLASKLASYECVKKFNFMKGGLPGLENGLYLKPEVEYGDWGRLWKIDIWSIDRGFVDKKQALLQDYKDRMTDQQRKLILEYKFSILNGAKRTPIFSGFYTYQAVIDKGMTDFKEITDYLRANHVEV